MCFDSTGTPHLTNKRKGRDAQAMVPCAASHLPSAPQPRRPEAEKGAVSSGPHFSSAECPFLNPVLARRAGNTRCPSRISVSKQEGEPHYPVCCDASTPRSPPGTAGLQSNWWTVQSCQLLAELLLRVTEAPRAKALPLSCGVASTCILGLLLRNTRDCPRSVW